MLSESNQGPCGSQLWPMLLNVVSFILLFARKDVCVYSICVCMCVCEGRLWHALKIYHCPHHPHSLLCLSSQGRRLYCEEGKSGLYTVGRARLFLFSFLLLISLPHFLPLNHNPPCTLLFFYHARPFSLYSCCSSLSSFTTTLLLWCEKLHLCSFLNMHARHLIQGWWFGTLSTLCCVDCTGAQGRECLRCWQLTVTEN